MKALAAAYSIHNTFNSISAASIGMSWCLTTTPIYTLVCLFLAMSPSVPFLPTPRLANSCKISPAASSHSDANRSSMRANPPA